MTDDSIIEGVRCALRDLNLALSNAVGAGLEVDVSEMDVSVLGHEACQKLVAIRLTRVRKELDVQL